MGTRADRRTLPLPPLNSVATATTETNTMTISLDTRTDIKGTPQAKLGTFEIKSSTTVSGWKISGTVAPSTPTITKVRPVLCARVRALPRPPSKLLSTGRGDARWS